MSRMVSFLSNVEGVNDIMAINDPKVVYIPNVSPSWISIRGNLAAVNVPWDIPNKKWAKIHCFADDIVDGYHPAVFDVSNKGTKALELFVDDTYTVYSGSNIWYLSGITIARTILSKEELERQGFGPTSDGGGGGQGSAPAAVLELTSEPEEETTLVLDDTLYDYFEELRRLRSKIEEYEPEPEEDEPGLELY